MARTSIGENLPITLNDLGADSGTAQALLPTNKGQQLRSLKGFEQHGISGRKSKPLVWLFLQDRIDEIESVHPRLS